MSITVDKEVHDELVGLIEDTVTYHITDNWKHNNKIIGGEASYKLIRDFATIKIEHCKGNFAEFDRSPDEDLVDLIEDSISMFTSEYDLSASLAWLITECYCLARCEQFKGNLK